MFRYVQPFDIDFCIGSSGQIAMGTIMGGMKCKVEFKDAV